MDNKDENYLNAIPGEKITEDISSLAGDIDTQGSNLGQTKDSLLTMDKIGEVSSGYPNPFNPIVKTDVSEASSIETSPEISEVQREEGAQKSLKQSIVRTFKSDAEEAVKMERLSSMSIAIAEQKKRLASGLTMDIDAPTTARKWIILFASLFFVVAGVGAISFSYIKEKIYPKVEESAIKSSIQNFIMTESSVEVDLNKTGGKDLVNLLADAVRSAGIKLNSIQNIYITENEISVGKGKETKNMIESKKFVSAVNFKMPDLLQRSLTPEFMLGLHYWNGNQPFLILKTDSYGNAFAGMLEWEKNMKKDLGVLFSLNSRQSNKVASSTDDIFASERDFEDVFVKNKDARAIRDANGEVFLIYDLHDKDTIVITTNTTTLTELSDRLVRARTVR